MKLNIPAALENADRKEKLSPTTGQPKLPGITSISFGEIRDCSQKKAENTSMLMRTKTSKMLSSIASRLIPLHS